MTKDTTSLCFVTTSERPDLTAVTGAWRWDAFFCDGDASFEELMARERAAAADDALLPTVFVLLDGGDPVGMVALCNDDLDDRCDLNPWLAGLYVAPTHRGKGHARRLIEKTETAAHRAGIRSLSLYTASAADLYRSSGWTTIETFNRDNTIFHIMHKAL
ncbi:GNAT superfamily N-acetyltransferase [Rhizobium sp. SG_E_25_P2]|uniref:GNAT family N-acetyltransferase n=1 Tax=Rhizobium sp. SG_E_25_P2 TaxID=2879942 RepID=UPI002473CB77|nr:GNAT family N-acetyltransferase [Rhizobium sp. SG_E_25_P2]MDH6269255.1 GNAT superfamily N-acetyltransferase [Rhizobium sp. SG_E_25_P2]